MDDTCEAHERDASASRDDSNLAQRENVRCPISRPGMYNGELDASGSPIDGGDLPYIFVSYARTDYSKVKPIINALLRLGYRIWHDGGASGEGIPAGKKWDEWIRDRLDKSAAFLGFVSQHNEHRYWVLDEMQTAIERHHAEREANCKAPYPVFFVCLERVSFASFPEKCHTYMDECQYVQYKKYGGLTERFISRLNNMSWPEGIVDATQVTAANKTRLKQYIDNDSAAELGLDAVESSESFHVRAHYEFDDDEFELDGARYPFAKTSTDQVDHNTVYATFFDNQWIPEEAYALPEFKEQGLNAEAVKQLRLQKQREEFCRSLLHNWQIVLNRASVWNSSVFAEWYAADVPDSNFAKLVKDGAIVVFLMNKENVPYKKAIAENRGEAERGFHVNEDQHIKWIEFCKNTKVHCLRFDWDSEESNEFESSQLVGRSFQDFCITAASNDYLMEALAHALGIADPKKKAFRDRWRDIQIEVAAWSECAANKDVTDKDKGRTYTREQLYKEFLIKKGTEVDKGVLDLNRPFAQEIKRVVDLQYSLSLPSALQIQPLLSNDSILGPEILGHGAAVQRQREIESDELVYAVTQFLPIDTDDKTFQGRSYALKGDLALADVVAIRELPSWIDYMAAVAESKERSRLDQLDLYDSLAVWKRHRILIADIRKNVISDSERWRDDGEEALSIIFHFEETSFAIIYNRSGTKLVHAQQALINAGSEKIASHLNRKTRLSVGFVCGDVSDGSTWKSNALLTELQVFDGLTHSRGAEAIEKLVNRLLELQTGVRIDPSSQDE